MLESRKHPVPPLRKCPSDIVAKPGHSVGQLSSVRSPVGEVRSGLRGCQRFCQVGARLQLRIWGILFRGSSVAWYWCRRSTFWSAVVSLGIAEGERERSFSIFVAKISILNCSSSKCCLPICAPGILIPSDVHGSIRQIGVCSVAQLRCDGAGLGIKIKHCTAPAQSGFRGLDLRLGQLNAHKMFYASRCCFMRVETK